MRQIFVKLAGESMLRNWLIFFVELWRLVLEHSVLCRMLPASQSFVCGKFGEKSLKLYTMGLVLYAGRTVNSDLEIFLTAGVLKVFCQL